VLEHPFLFGRNLRLALRFLVRNWRFTLVACGTLALGLGVNTAIFSVAYGIALKPLPFPNSGALVELGAGRTVVGERTSPFLSVPAMEDVIGGSRTLKRIGYRMIVTTIRTGIPESETLDGMLVSGGFFDAYGVSPALGRTIGLVDTEFATDRAVVLMTCPQFPLHG
jgi:putative ABC transport system permease protein